MFQIAYDYQKPWPENEPLQVKAHFDQEITISPVLARRKANGFLAGYVTMMVSAGQPTLILNEQPFWRVPAVLNLPYLGEVSTLGAIDIDAQTGKIIPPSAEQISRMQELAHAIAAYFAPSTTPAG
jgi:hypothetical protein